MLTTTQKQTAQSIINIFETSAVLGEYGSVTVIDGDTGHLTFGRSQTTLASGNLFELLQRYCNNAGARFSARLTPWLPRVQAEDFSLDNEIKFHNLLRATADDKVMRDTQDVFFDTNYWQLAQRSANNVGITSPLGVAVVYDSTVQGSWIRMRDRTNQQAGTIAALGEQRWIAAYIATRRQWLATNGNPVLRKTVYRMDAFQRLIAQGFWGLELPLVVCSVEISLTSLSGTPPHCYDGPQPGTRSIAAQSPMLRGLDVRLLQLGLSDCGIDIIADGVFGQTSAKRLTEYQASKGMIANGVADPSLVLELANA